jgi:hypothetical protein
MVVPMHVIDDSSVPEHDVADVLAESAGDYDFDLDLDDDDDFDDDEDEDDEDDDDDEDEDDDEEEEDRDLWDDEEGGEEE